MTKNTVVSAIAFLVMHLGLGCQVQEGSGPLTLEKHGKHKAVTEYRFYLCWSDASSDDGPRTYLITEYTLPRISQENSLRARMLPELNMIQMARWAEFADLLPSNLLDPNVAGLSLSPPNLIRTAKANNAEFTWSFLAQSRDRRYLATVLYCPEPDLTGCAGYANYQIHDLLTSSVAAHFDVCLQSLNNSFSGFLADTRVLAMYLKYDGVGDEIDWNKMANKAVVAIDRNGSSKKMDELRAMLVASSPDGHKVVFARAIIGGSGRDGPSELELELRDANSLVREWQSSVELADLQNVRLVWSTDASAVAYLSEETGRHGKPSLIDFRLFDANSGNLRSSGTLPIPSNCWLGPALLTPIRDDFNPWVELGLEQLDR